MCLAQKNRRNALCRPIDREHVCHRLVFFSGGALGNPTRHRRGSLTSPVGRKGKRTARRQLTILLAFHILLPFFFSPFVPSCTLHSCRRACLAGWLTVPRKERKKRGWELAWIQHASLSYTPLSCFTQCKQQPRFLSLLCARFMLYSLPASRPTMMFACRKRATKKEGRRVPLLSF